MCVSLLFSNGRKSQMKSALSPYSPARFLSRFSPLTHTRSLACSCTCARTRIQARQSLVATFNRPNITYQIRYKRHLPNEDAQQDIVAFLSSRAQQCGIICECTLSLCVCVGGGGGATMSFECVVDAVCLHVRTHTHTHTHTHTWTLILLLQS